MPVERGTYDGPWHIVAGGDLNPLLDPSSRGDEGGGGSVERVDMWLVDGVGLLDEDGGTPACTLAALPYVGGWAPSDNISCGIRLVLEGGKICFGCVNLLHSNDIGPRSNRGGDVLSKRASEVVIDDSERPGLWFDALLDEQLAWGCLLYTSPSPRD